jgi:hypothetical protein
MKFRDTLPASAAGETVFDQCHPAGQQAQDQWR